MGTDSVSRMHGRLNGPKGALSLGPEDGASAAAAAPGAIGLSAVVLRAYFFG